jgi:hypothetical protein
MSVMQLLNQHYNVAALIKADTAHIESGNLEVTCLDLAIMACGPLTPVSIHSTERPLDSLEPSRGPVR